MPSINVHSLEEAFLFLAQAVRDASVDDPRSADWCGLAMKAIAAHIDSCDPNAGTNASFVKQVLLPFGGQLPRTDTYMSAEEARSGWVHYVAADGLQAIWRDGEATIAALEPSGFRPVPVDFIAS